MKNIRKIMLVTAVAAFSTLANRASASDAVLSPHAQANHVRVVSGTNNDPDLAHGQFAQTASPKVQEQRQSVAMAAGNSKNDPDLVHQYAATVGTPKQKEQQPMQFEIAPLK